MKPLFSVGEECVLQSRDYPEMNGDVQILSVLADGDSFACPHCGRVNYNYRFQTGYAYHIDKPVPNKCCRPVSGKALRKKYDPGMKFDELIKSLKSPEIQK